MPDMMCQLLQGGRSLATRMHWCMSGWLKHSHTCIMQCMPIYSSTYVKHTCMQARYKSSCMPVVSSVSHVKDSGALSHC